MGIAYMKLIREITVGFIFILINGSCLAYADKLKDKKETKLPIVNLLSEVYPPYQVMNENGELSGWSADKVKALFIHADIDHHVEVYPWVRAYQLALTQPNTLIYSLLRTDIREDSFHWVAPLCTIEFSFYRAKSRADIQINSMKDAKHYRIAAQKGQASTEYLLNLGFKDKVNLSISYKNDNFIQMLVQGRVELIVLSSPFVKSLISINSANINEIEAIYPIEYLRENLYLAASLNTSPIIIKKLQQAYQELPPEFDDVCHD